MKKVTFTRQMKGSSGGDITITEKTWTSKKNK